MLFCADRKVGIVQATWAVCGYALGTDGPAERVADVGGADARRTFRVEHPVDVDALDSGAEVSDHRDMVPLPIQDVRSSLQGVLLVAVLTVVATGSESDDAQFARVPVAMD